MSKKGQNIGSMRVHVSVLSSSPHFSILFADIMGDLIKMPCLNPCIGSPCQKENQAILYKHTQTQAHEGQHLYTTT